MLQEAGIFGVMYCFHGQSLGETGKISSWQATFLMAESAGVIQMWLLEAFGIEDEERLINAKFDCICKPGFYETKNKNDLTFKLARRCMEVEGSAIRHTRLQSPCQFLREMFQPSLL